MSSMFNIKSLLINRLPEFLFTFFGIWILFACQSGKDSQEIEMANKQFSTGTRQIPTAARKFLPPPKQVYAEPITSSLFGHYPHLKPYLGHVVMGNDKIQAILNGIPTQQINSPWQLTILTFFIWSNLDGWKEIELVSNLYLKRSHQQKTYFAPFSLDHGVSSDGNKAHTTVIYTPVGLHAPKIVLKWYLDISKDYISLITNWLEPAQNKIEDKLWQIKLANYPRNWITNKLPNSNLILNYVFYDFFASLGFISLNPLAWEQDQESLILTPKVDDTDKISGLIFFIGDSSVQNLKGYQENLDACQAHKKAQKPNNVDDLHAMLIDCMEKKNRSLLSVDIPNKPVVNFQKNNYYILNENYDPISFLRISKNTNLIKAKEYKFIAPITESKQSSLSAKIPIEEQKDIIELHELPKSIINFHNLTKASHLLIKQRDPFTEQKFSIFNKPISTSDFTLTLNQGDYFFYFYSPKYGFFCERELILAENIRNNEVVCDQQNNHFQFTNKEESNYFQINDNGWQLDLFLHSSKQDINEQWQIYQNNRNEPLLLLFSKFAKKYYPKATLELGCPSKGMNVIDYLLLIKQIKPHATRLIGCHSGVNEYDWLNAYNLFQSALSHKLELTVDYSNKQSFYSTVPLKNKNPFQTFISHGCIATIHYSGIVGNSVLMTINTGCLKGIEADTIEFIAENGQKWNFPVANKLIHLDTNLLQKTKWLRIQIKGYGFQRSPDRNEILGLSSFINVNEIISP